MRRILVWRFSCWDVWRRRIVWRKARRKSASGGLTGHWLISADYYGTTLNASMDLTQQGDKIGGTFRGGKVDGSVSGKVVKFVAKDDEGNL